MPEPIQPIRDMILELTPTAPAMIRMILEIEGSIRRIPIPVPDEGFPESFCIPEAAEGKICLSTSGNWRRRISATRRIRLSRCRVLRSVIDFFISPSKRPYPQPKGASCESPSARASRKKFSLSFKQDPEVGFRDLSLQGSIHVITRPLYGRQATRCRNPGFFYGRLMPADYPSDKMK